MSDTELDPESQRKRIIAQRNVALALLLAGLAVLFFFITWAQFGS